ncbi:MAG: NAD-dependent epimerase/dehydratase family protein [Mycobacteriales bacterium]|nr:NAD-dependent epimerase/dehydratase family protein [Mycobacteriales bacterium]
MRVLVLGGTSFVGRAIVEELRAGGDEVTLFGRGRTGTGLFPDVERRVGDRSTGDYAALRTGEWDCVVDVSGYVPRHVQQAAEALLERVARCLLVSTGSVYDRLQGRSGMDESSPRLAPRRDTEDYESEAYGPLKVACEDDLAALWGSRATVVRPGVVAGPHDPTDRFTWWVRRAARGGRVALPGRAEQPVQVVDAGDLGRLVASLVRSGLAGTFNAVGPADPVTLGSLIETCAEAAGTSVEVVEVEHRPGFPLVLADQTWDVMFRRSSAAARAVGLTATPLLETARATLAWDRDRGEPPLAVELSPEEEATLLADARPTPA